MLVTPVEARAGPVSPPGLHVGVVPDAPATRARVQHRTHAAEKVRVYELACTLWGKGENSSVSYSVVTVMSKVGPCGSQ